MTLRMRRMVLVGVLLASAFAPMALASAHAQQPIDWSEVDAAMGRTGGMQPGENYRFNMPRSDLTVVSQGVQIRPSFALGSWLAFKQSGANEAVVMGDLVLTEEELNPVLARLQQGGVGQTAVHKHLLDMEPAIWWAHVHAEGDPVEIAETVREALALSGTPPQAPAAAPPALALDTAQISRILGYPGRNNGGVYNLSVARAETIRSHGMEIPPSMGLTTVFNFQPTGNGRAAINGDYIMTAGEVDRVIAALRENDIQVVELHHHLTDEEPRLFFMHFWANGDAVTLARGLRAALDQTNVQRPGGGR
jgi:Domain of Unknown Function (DUF1259)